MYQPVLSKQHIGNLGLILEEANKSFLKESRVSQQPNFNILRVLSAFRLLYPDSPSVLYNAIIYITKNYNPNSLSEWKSAVNEMSLLKKKVKKQKNNYCVSEVPLHMKTYQNSFNRERSKDSHFQSKSFAQIKMPIDISLSDQGSIDDRFNKDASRTNAETGKRQYYTKADSQQQQNHYISFEPYHHISDIYPNHFFDKENVNSTNIGESRKKDSSYQYIEAIRRDLGKTTKNSINKSPIDQSFIRNIDSYQSPYLLSQPDLIPIDLEQQQMNQRAYAFLRFNLYFKGFSSILATTMVLQRAKQHLLKAETKNRQAILLKTFAVLKENEKFQKMVKQKQLRAIDHHNETMKRKIFNVFKLIFDLRNKKSQIDVQKFNNISYDFILSLLLSIENKSESQSEWLTFDQKINELIQTNDSNKIYLIIKYFGKHSWINQSNMKKIVNIYRNSICKKVFSVLLRQREQNQRYFEVRQKYLSYKTFNVLKNRWLRIKNYKIKIMEAQGTRNKVLLIKVMKSLLELVYSTKLYSQRCQYLQKKYQMNTKGKILTLWTQETQNKQAKFQKLKSTVKLTVPKMLKFFKRFSLRMIQEDIVQMDDNINEVMNVIHKSKSQLFLCHLKNLHKQTVFYQTVKSKERQLLYRLTLSKWKTNTKKGKALNIFFKTIKNYYFRLILRPVLKENIEIHSEIKENEMKMKENILKALKIWHKNIKQRFAQDTLRLDLTLNLRKKSSFFIGLSKNHQIVKKQRKNKQINQNKLIIQQFITQRMKKYFLKKSFLLSLSSKKIKQNANAIGNNVRLLTFKGIINNLNKNRVYKIKIKECNQFILKSRTRQANFILSKEILQLKYNKLLSNKKKIILKQISTFAKFDKKQNQSKYQKAIDFWGLNIKQKVINNLRQQKKQQNQLYLFLQNKIRANTMTFIQSKLMQLRNQNAVKKIYIKQQKRQFLQNLKVNIQTTEKLQQINCKMITFSINRVFQSLRSSLNEAKNKKTNYLKYQYLSKQIVLGNLKQNLVNSLIRKKYQFMAVKFRALKICQLTFRSWKRMVLHQNLKLKQPIQYRVKAKDRLSTDMQ